MLTDTFAKPVPSPALPLVAHSQPSLGDGSATAFPWSETAGQRAAGGSREGARRGDVVAGWLKALGLSFGSPVRLIEAHRDLKLSGDGPVCRTLDGLCGRRVACVQVHRTLHATAYESGRIQQTRCLLGFLLISAPVRVKESWFGQIEFGPLGVERIDRSEFERNLSRLGFRVEPRLRLLASLDEVRTVRANDIEGVLALVDRVAGVIADEAYRAWGRAAVGEPAAVAAGRRYAELHIADKILLADVARHVALSTDHFSRLFRGATGLAFGEYVNRRRVENAQQLLRDSAQRVSDISYACGFDSVPHFNRVFRRLTGISPTRFRQLAGSAHDRDAAAASGSVQLENCGRA